MRSKEQFDLQMQWLDKELERYNNYKKEAVIERFNQLRSILKDNDMVKLSIKEEYMDYVFFQGLRYNIYNDENELLYDDVYDDDILSYNIINKNHYLIELINLIDDYLFKFINFEELIQEKDEYGYYILF